MDVLHLRGPVLVGPEDVRVEAWVVGGRITFERPTAPGADVQELRGWVLPGLVDAHCHVGLGPGGAVDAATTEQQALTDRDSGALLLRDAGSAADTRWVDSRPDLPRILRAGRHLARTRRYLRGLAEELEPADLPAAVREQARRGDGWVKVVGDWIDRDSGDLAPCWDAATLRAAAEAAHGEGARITAHQFGEDGVAELIDAGFDGIEHGTGLTAATIARAAAAGVVVVPTLVNIATFPGIAERAEGRFPRYAAHMRALHARRRATVREAWEAGVPVRAGTDAGSVLPHGLIVEEVAELAAAGLPAVAALDAATWAARRWLGADGLQEGADADLVVCPADPRADLGALRALRAVVLRGAPLPAAG
ncbi:amidohydrolase family protein [Kineococcus glutinatus]|uniref:Amidohydrolase family protein n=1 Tax=Kineococcus glutinatus TaxID=1070872 RepID=A0ABP9HA69_9ACTN